MKFFLLSFLIFIVNSCNRVQITDSEMNNICYEFIKGIHSKDLKKCLHFVDKKAVIKNFQERNVSINDLDEYYIFDMLFLKYSPLKSRKSFFQEKLINFHKDDLFLTVLNKNEDFIKVKVEWYNIFNRKRKECLIFQFVRKRITDFGICSAATP
ncbi:hypothetical protein [Algibacter sp. 2305UL17-15]|uniref:hypothetical protein n=1 Tax=Algibacter sp. 2305UL17-15 TaxID=3231268 RepID=UPI00345A197F